MSLAKVLSFFSFYLEALCKLIGTVKHWNLKCWKNGCKFGHSSCLYPLFSSFQYSWQQHILQNYSSNNLTVFGLEPWISCQRNLYAKMSYKSRPNIWQLFGLFWRSLNWFGQFLGNLRRKKIGYFLFKHLVTLGPTTIAMFKFWVLLQASSSKTITGLLKLLPLGLCRVAVDLGLVRLFAPFLRGKFLMPSSELV